MDDSSPLIRDETATSGTPVEITENVGPGRLQRVLRPLIAIAAVATVIGGPYLYFHALRYPSTEDAYVQAHVVQVAPQISGVVSGVHVINNQHVEADAPLFEIDSAPFVIAVDAAQAAFDVAVEAVGASGAGVTAAAAHVREAEATLANARSEAARGQLLHDGGNLSVSALDVRTSALKQAEAGLGAALAELDRAQQEYGHSGQENSRLRAASAELRKAQLNLSYTQVRAPAAGRVSNLTLTEGTVVTTGRPVFFLVEDREWWVDAHFKETDITRLKPGQPAKISIDMYPGVTFNGDLDSVSAGSGAAFSLMPPENATGNWVKVTQRYTARVRILDAPLHPEHPLRMGASAQVTLDTGK